MSQQAQKVPDLLPNYVDTIPHAGMGLIILDAIADQLTYKRSSDGWNCLSIVKNYNSLEPSQPSQVLQTAHICLHTELNSIVKVAEWFKQLELNLVPAKIISECELALTEGFTNALCHAHRHLPKTTPIKVETIVASNYVEIQICDRGDLFDFEQELSKRVSQHQNY